MKNLIFIFFLLGPFFANAQSERKIQNDSLPASVKLNITQKFDGYKISNAIITTEKGKQVYKVETRKEVNTDKTLIYNLVYDMEGKLISKKKDKEIYYSTAPEKETNKEKGQHNRNNPFPRY